MEKNYFSLLKFIPYFESKENAFYEYIPSYKDEEGTNIMGWIQYSEEVYEFIKNFHESDLVEYNYLEVLEKFGKIEDIESRIEIETFDNIKALLTFYIRRERFGEGCISKAINDG